MLRRILVSIGVLLLCGAFLPAQAQNRFWLENNSGETIREAYVSSSRVQNWGPDILGASVLPAGNRIWVTPTFSDCVLDVRVVYASGREETRMGVNACSLTRISFGGAGAVVQQPGAGAGAIVGGGPGTRVVPTQGNPSFHLINGTNQTIREVYASSSQLNSWGPDRLGASVLPPGNQVWINMPSGYGCLTDIRVVYMNGAVQERRGIETCSISAITWR
ncbi:MAG: Tat pathway signal protein [Rhodovarius sp.]|nr:Tat pathway signal protein [Rhodovarius sp.]MCX7933371.1 Tat pathway signal protein [Rhodovarius sp.]MDW8313679.1 Tat pathway signal protein [Rhodovarius sp.]